jgi:hypothetical protein
VSTDSGRPAYEKAGFEPIRELVLDLEEMGEDSLRGREKFTVCASVCFSSLIIIILKSIVHDPAVEEENLEFH